MAALSNKQAKQISNLINSLLVYSSMASDTEDEKTRPLAMKWFNETCDELTQFKIETIKYDIEG
jgi:hypothetical protein